MWWACRSDMEKTWHITRTLNSVPCLRHLFWLCSVTFCHYAAAIVSKAQRLKKTGTFCFHITSSSKSGVSCRSSIDHLIFAIQQKQMYWWRHHHEKTDLQVREMAKMMVNTHRPNIQSQQQQRTHRWTLTPVDSSHHPWDVVVVVFSIDVAVHP